ncbi:DUF445 domain-containing protein [Neobacillus ginsengisoli]|uniref:Uncharacterized membrane-anchored protein YjiN (DUF445 family) n=1 Tax=Neobacillus ginsengisoli TaxID=904295 RepID=A0ABT9XR79_9BACI|nr:DUF445 domain-containing protein [Neobacillus ginsengisoli]MDQ0198066.1 uncharacterized membrane-anchored protein YjiN (DUF445 family) [Neobacillus ginsengisoli]
MSNRKKKSQHLATISLAVMGIGFIATVPLQHSLWVTILQGGFEAGLVGGLADWFAVTALFRHPLGIPIPHTALLPKNRQRITATIISMVENDWLTKESIRKKIAGSRFTEKLFGIIDKELYSHSLQVNFNKIIQHLIHSIDSEKIAPMVQQELKTKLSELDIKKYLALMIDQISKRKYDEKALDYILKEIDEWSQRESTKYRLGSMAVDAIENIKADGFMQFALKSFSNLVNEEKLGNIIQNLIQKGVNSFQDPDNRNRHTLLKYVNNKLENIKSDENLLKELDDLKSQLVSESKLEERIIDFINHLKQKAYVFVEDPIFYTNFILPLLKKGLDNLKTDEEKVVVIETWIKQQISNFVEKNHSKIGKLVGENLEKLDDKTLINMIETNVGKDLQWIRVNGAVCGFIIGLFLIGIKSFF